jgi:hypothetical protein
MKKSIKIFRLLLAASLSVGLFTVANAQREGRTRSGGRSERAQSPTRTEPRAESNAGRIREVNRTQIDRPSFPQANVQADRNNNIVREQRADRNVSTPRVTPNSIEQRADRTTRVPDRSNGQIQRDNGAADRNNQFGQRNNDLTERSNRNNETQQRSGRDNFNDRNYRSGNNDRGYNNQRYRSYRSYEPRRYVYVGAPRYSILPRTSIHIQFGGYPYYYDNGLFYNYYGGFYQPVFAPRGIRISILPFGCMPFYYGANRYYYYNGIYYRPQDNNEYEVVDAPMGAQVSAMPKGTKAVSVNGEKFFEFNGTYYKEDKNNKGEVVYTVVGKNGEIDNTNEVENSPVAPSAFKEGDVVSQLPEGSRTVTINGQQLFASPDDVYFKLEVDGNNIRYKVVGTTADKTPVSTQEL